MCPFTAIFLKAVFFLFLTTISVHKYSVLFVDSLLDHKLSLF